MTIKHKLARLKQKLSHASLAGYIGVDSRTLGRWLSSKNTPLPIFQHIISDLHDKVFTSPVKTGTIQAIKMRAVNNIINKQPTTP